MDTTPRTEAPHPTLLRLLATALLTGLVGALLLGLIVIAVSIAVGTSLFVIIQTGFGSSSGMARVLAITALLATLGVASLLIWLLKQRLLPLLVVQVQATRGGWLAIAAGALLGMGLGGWAMPEPIISSALQFVTGQSARQRAEEPAVQASRERLQQVLAANPQGPEAALIDAVNRMATPIEAPGRVVTGADVQERIAALRALLPTVPPGWQAVVLGTMAELQRGQTGGPAVPGPFSDALLQASQAGSPAFRVLAAQHLEEAAHLMETRGASPAADQAWRGALQGYAAAGAGFEVARLQDETLPERLRSEPIPTPPALPVVPADGDLAGRLWRLAEALGDDTVWDRARPGERDLAMALALVALERAPSPTPLAQANPGQRWTTSPWAIGRWILVLRHARGDCAAALELSDATRQRRRPAVVNQTQPGASELDLAWSVAWLEAAEACAHTPEERAQTEARRGQLDYLRLPAGRVEAARVAVAESLATLR